VCDEHRWTETAAFVLHAISVTGAFGVCAAQAHVYKDLHITFAAMFFLGRGAAGTHFSPRYVAVKTHVHSIDDSQYENSQYENSQYE
jgi:hypothetical protein